MWQNLLILTKLTNTKGIYTKNEDYRHLTDPANLVQTLVSKHLLHPILPHVFQIQQPQTVEGGGRHPLTCL